MNRRSVKKKQQHKQIARHRIKYLFHLAEQNALQGRMNRADRYVQLARKLSMRYLVPIPPYEKRRFCKHCYSYLLPSVNCRVRLSQEKLVTYCYTCRKFTRIPLKNKPL